MIYSLILSFIYGLGVGFIYFGGLWWSLQNITKVAKPGFWLLGSFIIRVIFVLLALALLGLTHWERLIACFSGFLLMRLLLVNLWGKPRDSTN